MRKAYLSSSLMIGMTAGVSLAVPVVINNSSFEDPGTGIPGWSDAGGPSTLRGAYAPFVPATFNSIPDGSQVAYLYNYGARI